MPDAQSQLTSSPGSWLLDPLAAPSSGPSILQTIVQSRAGGRRPRRSRNVTLGAPTAKFDSRHGNISAALRVVGDPGVPAVATIRSTTRSGNIVLELVSQNLRLTSGSCDLSTYGFLSDTRYRSPSPLRGWSISTHIPGRVSLRPICL